MCPMLFRQLLLRPYRLWKHLLVLHHGVGFPEEAAMGRAAVSCEALFCLAVPVPMFAALNPTQISAPCVHQVWGQDGVLAPLSTLWQCPSPLAHLICLGKAFGILGKRKEGLLSHSQRKGISWQGWATLNRDKDS